ncbi:LLM class flavin-dependent oxidoreductase [Mucilaginibacter sp. HMF5004]|uniref:LLM class flavin-dependent oxidoreductase n=1 Tax=Mucilaginibacter rivuli TaxID=2857527 RepID=UPI001C5F3D59|nr:LLM class flavin-dependent oxidoreductase [Mucilaginibacter rivuli]MBW4891660.1 LLM class flavin-dependent oxidoreductase [Mucilaginibacter rivuli]
MKNIKLSILDQSTISKGGRAIDAIQQTVQLVQKAEECGYHRFWVSEHHNLASIAGSAPEVLIAHLAAVTKQIRLGSGGIMLPNHSSLKVAENFRLLETMAPGRIDLGIGRAPGGDRITASLLNPGNRFKEEDYIQQVNELQLYFNDQVQTQFGVVKAIPVVYDEPPIWMLTSSGSSAVTAADMGLGLAFAQFISAAGVKQAIATYRQNFVPSDIFPKPEVIIAIWVLCADTEEKANELKQSLLHVFLQMEKGEVRTGMPPYDEIKDYPYTIQDRMRMDANSKRLIAGTPEQVKQQIIELAEDCDADEIMAAAITFAPEDKVRSFELLADVFALKQVEQPFQS